MKAMFVLAVMLMVVSSVCGQVQLQGRAVWSGAEVSAGGVSTTTRANGLYMLTVCPGTHTVVVRMPLYLDAEKTLVVVAGLNALPSVRLPAGDLNDDNRIDAADIEIVSGLYGTTSAQADVNADGIVDIVDVALVAGNVGRTGPISW